MIKRPIAVINDFSGGQDTKTPIISMGLNKSPNMRNYHCAGIKERLIPRGGFSKLNSSAVESDGLDAFYPPGYQTYDYAIRDTAARTQISQGFKSATSSTVTKVRLWLKKTGTPAGTDTVTLVIQTDSSGVPSGTPVTNGTATAVDCSDTLTTSYAWVTFTFATNPTLTAGTQYHLVLQGAFTISDVNYVSWGADNYDIIYANGSMSVYDGTTWVVDSLYNACFEVYITNGAKGNDGYAIWDFSSKNMMLGIFGTSLYKMDKNSAGTPDGTWDSVGGSSAWDSYTKLILHCDGTDAATTFTDEIGKIVTAVGNAQIDTAQKKFGTASGLFDGTGDYLTVPDSDDWNFGTGDFTVDFQIRINTVARDNAFFDLGNYIANAGLGCYRSSAGNLVVFMNGGAGKYTNAWVPVAGTWYHVEISRSGTDLKVFIDGTQLGATVTNSTDIQAGATGIAIGYSVDASNPMGTGLDGWIDEFRVSKGVARHTANFTAPTAAYSASALPLTSSRHFTFADWQSGRALVNTDIGLYTYLGTGNASTVSGAPIGKFTVIWRNYVFMAGIRGSPNTVRYSDLNDYITWTSTNTLSVNTNDGDVITGMRILKGKLYIFKRYSIHRISFLGSNPTFQVDPILGIGCPAHYTIKEVELSGDIGTVLVFLSTDKKLVVFDGYNIQVINDSMTEETNDLFGSSDDQPLSFADINLVYSDLFHAVVKTDTSEYILYCVLGTDTTINYAFVFDYKTGGIYPYDNQVFSSSAYVISTNKVRILYCAGYSGYMWQMESGTSDDSSAISAYWVSGKIKPSLVSLLTKALQLALILKEVSSGSAHTLNFQFRIDWNVSWTTAETATYNRADALTFGKTALFDIGTIENMLQIKISNNSTLAAPTIYGVDLYGTPLGLEVGERAIT
mgnify:CR=1 FL=1